MTFAATEYDDDAAVRRPAWLAQGDHAALDKACDVCLSYLDVDLAIRGRAIGLLAGCSTATSQASPLAPPQTPAPPAASQGRRRAVIAARRVPLYVKAWVKAVWDRK
jgi:hypothetical protein